MYFFYSVVENHVTLGKVLQKKLSYFYIYTCVVHGKVTPESSGLAYLENHSIFLMFRVLSDTTYRVLGVYRKDSPG
jgi:hypothetical protein